MLNLQDKMRVKALRELFFLQLGIIGLLVIMFLVGNYLITIGTLFFAVVLGGLGASISLLNKVRDNNIPDESTFDQLKIFATLIPILYGTVMAGVAYLLFMSGILSGEGGGGLLTTNLFPNFKASSDASASILEQFLIMTPDGMQETGKLLVWCFLAGYSERFVTGILGQLENKAGVDPAVLAQEAAPVKPADPVVVVPAEKTTKGDSTGQTK